MDQAKLKSKYKHINYDAVSLYLNFWGVEGIDISEDDDISLALKDLVPKEFLRKENLIKISNRINKTSLSPSQFLYDIEVFNTVYSKIRQNITFERFCCFYKGMVNKMSLHGWKFLFAGNNFITEK